MKSQISMRELFDHSKKLSGQELILDVRGRDEFAGGHVPGAKNIPHDEIIRHIEDLKRYARIYVHCRSGGRAARAIEALEAHGLTNLVCIAGSGMPDWEAAGFPVER